MPATAPASVLKTLWKRGADGRWEIHGAKGIDLFPKPGYEADYFAIQPQVQLLSNRPPGPTFSALLQTFGTSQFLLQQSILPVVAFLEGGSTARCIGTAFVISCSGVVITAGHVLMDPIDSGYVQSTRVQGGVILGAELNMGVLLPLNAAHGIKESLFLPFERAKHWGSWYESPLLHERDRFDLYTDVAVCKIAELDDGRSHQPLNLSLNPFRPGELTFTIGYAEMQDFPIEVAKDGGLITPSLDFELFVSTGPAVRSYPENHQLREVPTPGPCFEYHARIPGKMSGAPIFGADGAVVRGVVSRSFSGERHAFGAMMGPAMHLPLWDDRTLSQLMGDAAIGMPRVQGQGT